MSDQDEKLAPQLAGQGEIEYVGPKPSRATKPSVWAYAEKLRSSVKLSNGFELAQLIKQNGGEISYIDFSDADQKDAIVVLPDESFTIRLSSHTGALRDNFTIAHELGHKLLHWPQVKKEHPGFGMKATRWVDESDQQLVRCEWEANWFASAFLMPAAEFGAAYKNGVASEIFGVTESAVQVRAKNLGFGN